MVPYGENHAEAGSETRRMMEDKDANRVRKLRCKK